jgi:hypothetical protein
MEGGPLRISKPPIYNEYAYVDPAVVAAAEERRKEQRNQNRTRAADSNMEENYAEEVWQVPIPNRGSIPIGNVEGSLEEERNLSWANNPFPKTPRNQPIRRNSPPSLKRTYGKRKLVNRTGSPIGRKSRSRRNRRNSRSRKSRR